MKKIQKKIIIIVGDPNSINSEIVFKSWRKLNKSLRKKIVIIASFELLKKQFSQLKYSIKLKKINKLNDTTKSNELNIINVNLKFTKPFNVEDKNAALYVIKCLNLGHKLALSKYSNGIINCAINKKLLSRKNKGVTEFLAKRCGIKDNSEVMMIKNKNFSVCPLTTHLDLKYVSQNIKSKIIITKLKTVRIWFKKIFNKKPKIGILGLNPHNSELRIKSEEKKEIIPAIKRLKKIGFKIEGPLVADTIFINDYKKYDVIVGMYHDQVLAPFKALFKFDAINITLGLKYFRASPDHGVARNIIKKNKANPSSLLECIKFVNKLK